jgi:hypothetical protein
LVSTPGPNRLELLRELTGEEGPELARCISCTSVQELAILCESLLAETGLPVLGEPVNRVRPLISARLGAIHLPAREVAYTDSNALGGLNLFTATDPRFIGSAIFSRALARLLLYCHSIILEDPLALGADMFLSAREEVRDLARRFFEAAVVTSLEMGELVDAGIVCPYWIPRGQERRTRDIEAALVAGQMLVKGERWVSDAWDAFEAVYADGLHPALRETWRRIRSGDSSPDLSLIEEACSDDQEMSRVFVLAVSSLQPQAVVDNVIETLAAAIDDALALGGSADFYAPSALFTQLLLAAERDRSDVDAQRLRELARIDVPRLDDLTWRDVVALRQNEESFALWRMHLSRGLDRLTDLRERGLVGGSVSIVADELLEARIALETAKKKSSFMSRFGSSSLAFVIGAAGGFVGGLSAGPAGAAEAGLGAGMSAAAGVLVAGNRRPERYRLRHYVMFDQSAT